jgi:hypothetical protein
LPRRRGADGDQPLALHHADGDVVPVRVALMLVLEPEGGEGEAGDA